MLTGAEVLILLLTAILYVLPVALLLYLVVSLRKTAKRVDILESRLASIVSPDQ